MVTPLDIGALKEFNAIFAMLFVFVTVYAILQSLEWFKEKKVAAGLIAFTLSFMTLYSTVVMKTITLMAPWFVLFIIFITLIMLGFMMLGTDMKKITELLYSGEFNIGILLFSFLLVIMVGSLSYVWTEETGGFEKLLEKNVTAAGERVEITFWQTIFHPKFLGLVLVLLIAAFTIKYMTDGG